MKRNICTLLLGVSMASVLFVSNVLAVDAGNQRASEAYDFDGDIIDNPWADLFPSEKPTESQQQPGVNVALNKVAQVSGIENSDYAADKALDGNTGTRWSSNYEDNAWIAVDLGRSYTIDKVVLNWEAAYATAYSIQVSSNGTTWTTVKTLTNQDGGEDVITFSAVSARYVKMQGAKRALPYGYSLWEMEVYTSGSNTSGNEPSVEYGVLSKGKNVTVSGVETDGFLGHYAVDGNNGTRWSSDYSDNAWIVVDLGKSYTVDKVVLNWEAAYGTAYNIQVSTDGTRWTTVKSLTNQDGGEDVVTFSAVTARYVKMQGVKRALQYGYSLWEMDVYGK